MLLQRSKTMRVMPPDPSTMTSSYSTPRPFAWSLLLALTLATTPFISRAQVVPIQNPGFEDSVVPADHPWPPDHWYAPETDAEPLVFKTDFTGVNEAVSVPQNIYGYEPGHGNSTSYIGVTTYSASGDQRKYFCTNIPGLVSDQLFAGVDYCMSMWMSLADSSMYATASFEALPWMFPGNYDSGSDSVEWLQGLHIPLNTIAVGKEGWTLVESVFTPANNLGTFSMPIIFGNFKTDTYIDTVRVSDTGYPMAMYWIDDIHFAACATSIPEQHGPLGLQLSPQPVQRGEQLHIALSGSVAHSAMLQINDLLGRTFLQAQLAPAQRSVDLPMAQFEPGIYFVSVSGASGRGTKFIVQ
jgi:hypothetical protein